MSMSFSMQMTFTSFLFIIYQFNTIHSLIYEAYGSNNQFDCDAAGSDDTCILHCDPNTSRPKFRCGNAGECYFYCQDAECMKNGILHAKKSNNLYAYSSHNGCFKNTQIYVPDAGNANIGINSIDEAELKSMQVYGGSNTQSIRIDCTGSDKETCKQIKVYAENTKYLEIIGASSSIMEDAVINCPVDSKYDGIPCNIDFSAGGIIKDGIFNTVNGIPKDIMITGTLAGKVMITCSNVNGVSENIGNSFENAGDCWITEAPTTDPTKQPTISPTLYPTAVPTRGLTTAKPTTYPTTKPTTNPTTDPTSELTAIPTADPTISSTKKPTNSASNKVTNEPTAKTTPTLTSDTTSILESDTTITSTKSVTMTRNTADDQKIIARKSLDSITTTTINREVNGEQIENSQHFKDSGSSSNGLNSSTANGNTFNFADHIVDIILLAVGVLILAICTCCLYFTIRNYRISKTKAIENTMKSYQNDQANNSDPTIIVYKSENDLIEPGKKSQGEITPQLPPTQTSMVSRSRVRTTSICSDAESTQSGGEGIFHDDIYMDDYDIMAGVTDAGNDEIIIGDDEEDIHETPMDSEDSMGLYGMNDPEIILENDHITPGGKLAIVEEEHQEEVQMENDEWENKLNLEDIHMAFDESPMPMASVKNIYNGTVIYYGTDIPVPNSGNVNVNLSIVSAKAATEYGDV